MMQITVETTDKEIEDAIAKRMIDLAYCTDGCKYKVYVKEVEELKEKRDRLQIKHYLKLIACKITG